MREYQPIVRFPTYLIREVTDDGMEHSEIGDDVHTDDLRVTLVLAGGTKVLIDLECRLIVTHDGITVEGLRDAE